MNKNLGIYFRFNDTIPHGIKIIRDMNESLLVFFMYIAQRCDNGLFISSLRQEKTLLHFRISRATYFNRLNKLVEARLLKRQGSGVYEVNLNYAKVVSDKDKELKATIKNFRV